MLFKMETNIMNQDQTAPKGVHIVFNISYQTWTDERADDNYLEWWVKWLIRIVRGDIVAKQTSSAGQS